MARLTQHLLDTLRLCRSAKGLSLSRAARDIGISKAHLHDMEAGKSLNPCISTLAGLSRAYSVPIGWLAEQFADALENPTPRCAADRDGECRASTCPQLRDGEPAATGRHCPLDYDEDDDD